MSRAFSIPLGDTAPIHEWAPSLRGNVIAGTLAIVLGFGGFFVWGYSVRLDSAAVASGSVVVDTKRKTVSHLEGGILEALLVTEGQAVKAGQPLVRLENTRARSDLRQLQSRRIGLTARLARLNAEQEGADAVVFPSELADKGDPFLAEIERNEVLLFERRRETLARTIDVQRKQIDVFTADAEAASAQYEANKQQQMLISKQISSMQSMFDKGYATRTQLIDLQGRLSVLSGDGGQFAGTLARAEQNRAGAELEISKTRTMWQSDIADAMQAAQIELSGVNDNITSAADVLKRVEVTSPEEGIVTNIQVSTRGSVVGAGAPIMDIVPEHDARIVEARIDPRDIDSVHVGASVQVRLSAYGTRQSAPIEGILSYVAADQTVDERTSAAYYVVKATISDKALAAAPEVTLYPGMPADLLILNRPRLAIDYIIAPLAGSLGKAFHEE